MSDQKLCVRDREREGERGREAVSRSTRSEQEPDTSQHSINHKAGPKAAPGLFSLDCLKVLPGNRRMLLKEYLPQLGIWVLWQTALLLCVWPVENIESLVGNTWQNRRKPKDVLLWGEGNIIPTSYTTDWNSAFVGNTPDLNFVSHFCKYFWCLLNDWAEKSLCSLSFPIILLHLVFAPVNTKTFLFLTIHGNV